MSGVAVHFGAGNIGRGFVGLLLHRAGYQVVVADLVDEHINPLNTTPSYQVKKVGQDSDQQTHQGRQHPYGARAGRP
jgi:mannitol-1-phosphate 5-dehydrogenase